MPSAGRHAAAVFVLWRGTRERACGQIRRPVPCRRGVRGRFRLPQHEAQRDHRAAQAPGIHTRRREGQELLGQEEAQQRGGETVPGEEAVQRHAPGTEGGRPDQGEHCAQSAVGGHQGQVRHLRGGRDQHGTGNFYSSSIRVRPADKSDRTRGFRHSRKGRDRRGTG